MADKSKKNGATQGQGGIAPRRRVSSEAHAAMVKRNAARKRAYHRRVAAVLVIVILCVVGICAAFYAMLNSVVAGKGERLPESVNTPAELKGNVATFLVCGIDYEEGRAYGNGNGMTDVILYVSMDLKANEVNVLQIPRDTYVGEGVKTGGTGKINAVFAQGDLTPKTANLATVINDQFGLPVDYYVTVDMEAFKAIIDALGGIEVYVPERLQLDSNVIEPGLQFMDGATAEFFVRYRNFAQADIKRLEMQRHFYAAVFNKFASFPITDIIKVLPAYMQYVNTDMSVGKMGSVFTKLMKVPKENITLYKVPGEAVTQNGQSVYTAHLDMLAQRINEGFRTYLQPITAADLKLKELAHTNDYITGEGVSLGAIN